jgi:prephenate dehydratase
MRIAIQGETGSFHHQAAKHWFGKDVEILPGDTFTETFDLLSNGADQAIVAIENTLYGSINETLDLIEKHRYPIVGEIYLHIHQQLIGIPGADPSKITQIYSHPVALVQCEQYLDTHFPHAERIEHHDTAGSVRLVAERNDPRIAAIAGTAAAETYGLAILAPNIEDNDANLTRFLVINPHTTTSVVGANKTSLTLTTSHTPGALAHALSVFAKSGSNLTKLQSRPIVGDPWNYKFSIDVESAGDPLEAQLAEIRQQSCTVTVLGQYKSGSTYE